MIPILVLTGGSGSDEELDGVVISNPENLHEVIIKFFGIFQRTKFQLMILLILVRIHRCHLLRLHVNYLSQKQFVKFGELNQLLILQSKQLIRLHEMQRKQKRRHLVLVIRFQERVKLVGMRATIQKILMNYLSQEIMVSRQFLVCTSAEMVL